MQVDPSVDSGSWLNSLDDIGVKPTLAAQVFASRILNRQLPDGHWGTIDVRPPQSYSVVTATAVAVRAIQRYLPASMDAERRAATDRARRWLQKVVPADTEDRTLQLLGLFVAGASRRRSCPAGTRAGGRATRRRRLGAAASPGQRRLRDGSGAGGAAASGRPALPAIRRSGADWRICCRNSARMAPGWSKHDSTNRTWSAPRISRRVSSRAPSDHLGDGHDVGGAWRCSSRCRCALPNATVLDGLPVDTPAEQPWMQTALFGTTKRTRPAVDQGLSANSRTPAGTTVLMMAAHDADKVARLLARGADVSALSDARHNALMVSANQSGSIAAMRLLLDKGASPEEPRPCRVAQALLADALCDLVRRDIQGRRSCWSAGRNCRDGCRCSAAKSRCLRSNWRSSSGTCRWSPG